jgi:S-adenosylmethionine:tRNA ribosyltransferase-isomerase
VCSSDLGTFQPVRVDDTDAHTMHAEWGEVPEPTARAIAETRTKGGRVVSIGTTALRLLETVARDRDGVVPPWTGETDIFITPGYRFRAVDLLLTNFHLPRSTLFMLVAAFAGLDRMKAAYAHAVRERYRFYSYGDCCLLRRSS